MVAVKTFNFLIGEIHPHKLLRQEVSFNLLSLMKYNKWNLEIDSQNSVCGLIHLSQKKYELL